MTKQDRQKVSILAILLAVLGLTIMLYRMNQPTTTAAVQVAEQKTSTSPVASGEGRIRLDLLPRPDAADDDVGKRNIFQFRLSPPPIPAAPRGGMPNIATSAPPITRPFVQTPPPGPPQPPPPPPIPLKYQGYAAARTPAGLTAFLVDDTRPTDLKHFNVKTGEVLMGRYRIASISEKSVEIEDLEYNRRQTLPLLK